MALLQILAVDSERFAQFPLRSSLRSLRLCAHLLVARKDAKNAKKDAME
jgi:hypothetical protein